MCIFCAQPARNWTITDRKQALELLAQLERPDGLPRDDALSLGARLLAWTESEHSRFQCEAPVPGASADCALSGEKPI